MKYTIAASAAMALLCLHNAIAGPADYVYTPHVEAGEREIDFKFGRQNGGNSPSQTASSLGFGYGASENWFTEVYVKYQKQGNDGLKYDAIEWENKFQLTEPGEYPVDVGLIVEIERPQDRSEGYELKVGPLFQVDQGLLQWNGNVLFERHFDSAGPEQTEMAYQWQVKYRAQPAFEYGLQGFGDIGEWNHWADRREQSHRAGPAIFGKLPLAARQALRYNAALLFGLSDAAADRTFRLQMEYEF